MLNSKSKKRLDKKNFIKQQQFELPPIDNASQVLQQKVKNIDLEQIITSDIKKKLKDDPQNDIKSFYKILEIDQSRSQKSMKNNWKSLHVISDLAQIRGTRFYKQRILSEFESQIRKKIDKEDGKTLLMSEIYLELEQNFDGAQIQKKKKGSILLDNTSVDEGQLMYHLDQFSKTVQENQKKEQKIQEEEQNQQQQQQQQQDRDKEYSPAKIRASQRYKTITRLSKTNVTKYNSNRSLPSPGQSPSSKDQQKKTPTLIKLLQKGNISSIKDKLTKDSQDTGERSAFVSAFINALKSLQTTNKEKGQNSAFKLPQDGDRSVQQKLVQYARGIGVNADESIAKNNDNELNFDYSPEGVKMTMDALYKSLVKEQFSTIQEKAKIYEKLTSTYDIRLSQKIKDAEAYINNKANIIRILRLENHQIVDKMREIQNLVRRRKQKKIYFKCLYFTCQTSFFFILYFL